LRTLTRKNKHRTGIRQRPALYDNRTARTGPELCGGGDKLLSRAAQQHRTVLKRGTSHGQ
ncbi:hypothetical protein, partial [Streptomyces sp. SID14515]|uniref:hypothetical protein n=1 Tax=Streptomyces sp. SID14515 TaxID=2706074 RepID=UPI001EF3232C